MDWRTDILKAIHDVLTRQINRTTVSEFYLPIISKNSSQELNTLLQRNMAEMVYVLIVKPFDDERD